MVKAHWLIPLLIAIFAQPVFAGTDAPLTVMTDERRPLAWRENGTPRGITYELVAATLKELGLNYPIEFTAFNRGLRLAQTQNNQVFFSVTRSPERNSTLKWVGPLVQNDAYVYKLKESPLKIDSLEDLRGLSGVGVVKSMSPDDYLTGRGLKNVMRSDSPANAVRALIHKRVDTIAMGQLTLRATATEIGAKLTDIDETPLKLFDSPLYIAFSLNVSDETIHRWQKALDKVKQERFRSLHNTYVR